MKKQALNTFKVAMLALAVAEACAQTAQVSQTPTDSVVVKGIRASAQSALARKKNATEVVDAITAEDIGKLADTNVAETLTRIPGVQGYRYGGEGASPVGQGSGLSIRGLSGQTASQVNGRAYFTAGSREFNIEGAIPGMVAGIDVFKNPSAEHIEGGIGGLVNIRTRNPSDFKEFTFSGSVTAKYNDLAREFQPEVFGLVANRWNLGGGRRIGALAGGVYQRATGRSDNNPANGGANFRRAIRADSSEYAALAAANTSQAANGAQTAYVGRSDIHLLTAVPTLPTSATVGANTPNLSGLTPDQIANVMVTPAVTSNVFQETIMRVRRGLSLGADYTHDDSLRFYVEANYNYYLYHQNYRGLNSVDGANVQNLTVTPFNFTEGLANRNINGGADQTLVDKRLQSGQFLRSTVNTIGGDEHRPYQTWIVATGAEWKPTPSLALKADFNIVKADQTQDNRSVNMDSAPGLFWTTLRVADGGPHRLDFSGPSLSDPNHFVFRDYSNGTRQTFDDRGHAAALSGRYSFQDGWLTAIKFGARLAHQDSEYRSFSFTGRPLTSDGLALTANRSNGILASAMPGVLQAAPTNFMEGKAGYAGGFLVYSPDALLGDQVRQAFPKAGIAADAALPENALLRRSFSEHTSAGYVSGEFSFLDDRVRGGLGVRLVRTDTTVLARVADTSSGSTVIVDNQRSSSYTNALPSLNVTAELRKNLLARFGYGKGITRPEIGVLSPSIVVNPIAGLATVGNPDLKPQIANSFDLSLERYFTPTNFVAAGVFEKRISGFFNGIVECQTLSTAPAYSGTIANSCTGGQYQVTKTVNSQRGYAKGLELSGQYFFDKSMGWLQHFGAAASYTFVKTSNPINIGTPAAPRLISTEQPFVSRHGYSLAGMYEDAQTSARLTYTWRSDHVLFGVSPNPIDGRYIGSYGILDASVTRELAHGFSLSLHAGNLLNRGLNRFVGEPGAYATGLERQHYVNGRNYALSLRYKFN